MQGGLAGLGQAGIVGPQAGGGQQAGFIRQDRKGLAVLPGNFLVNVPFLQGFGPAARQAELIRHIRDHLLTDREGYTSLSRLAAGLSDTPVTLAAKSLLRVGCPVVLAVSTNDGLGASGENIARLFQRKHYYFVPYGQDDPAAKPQSLKADFARLPAALEAALHGEQLQPVLLGQRERAMAFQPGQNVVY